MRRFRKGTRAGVTRSDGEWLDFLFRCFVMLRFKAAYFSSPDGGYQFHGRCLKCRNERWLQVSHIVPKGQYPAMRHDEMNALPLCFHCHLHWWHKNPEDARVFGVMVMGQDAWDDLWLRARAIKGKPDPVAVSLHLGMRVNQMVPGFLRGQALRFKLSPRMAATWTTM
jgi:hypothetical protein